MSSHRFLVASGVALLVAAGALLGDDDGEGRRHPRSRLTPPEAGPFPEARGDVKLGEEAFIVRVEGLPAGEYPVFLDDGTGTLASIEKSAAQLPATMENASAVVAELRTTISDVRATVASARQLLDASGPNLAEASDRIRRLQGAGSTFVVIAPTDAANQGIHNPAQARDILHATHALQTALRHEGERWVVHGAVLDLGTNLQVGDFSGSYTDTTLASLPVALAGAVSAALRLRTPTSTEAVNAAAA